MTEVTKKKKILQLLALALFLVVLPLGSWYFLNRGFVYQKQITEDLKERLGRLPAFQLLNSTGERVTNEELGGKVVIISFLSLAHAAQSQSWFDDLYKIQDQFDKKEDILFLTFSKAEALPALDAYVQSLNIKEKKRWLFLTEEGSIMDQLMASIPFSEGTNNVFEENSTVLLLDLDSNIRHFYDIKNRSEIAKLITHIARLMPRENRGRSVVKRETEK